MLSHPDGSAPHAAPGIRDGLAYVLLEHHGSVQHDPALQAEAVRFLLARSG